MWELYHSSGSDVSPGLLITIEPISGASLSNQCRHSSRETITEIAPSKNRVACTNAFDGSPKYIERETPINTKLHATKNTQIDRNIMDKRNEFFICVDICPSRFVAILRKYFP